MDAYAVAYSDFSQRFAQEAEAELLEISAGLEGFTVSSEVLFGQPAKYIVTAAERHGVGMIVMGTHGRTGLTRLLMGSVAEAIVRRAPCPVLVYREVAEKLAGRQSKAT